MKTIGIIVIILNFACSIFGDTLVWNPDSYGGRHFTTTAFENAKGLLTNTNLYRGSTPAYFSTSLDRAFVRDLWTNPSPVFAEYATADPDQYPLVRYVSEHALCREGKKERLTIPRNFRSLANLAPYGAAWRDSAEQKRWLELFLEACEKLPKSSFQTTGDLLREGKDASYFSLWANICRLLQVAESKDAMSFLQNLLLLQNELSQWCWDRDFIDSLGIKYGSQVKTLPMPNLCVLSAFCALDHNDVAFQSVCAGLWQRHQEYAQELIGFLSLIDEYWSFEITASILNTIERNLSLWGSLYLIKDSEPVFPSSMAKGAFLELGIDSEKADLSPEDARRIADILLADEKNALNYFALRVLGSNADIWQDDSFRTRWEQAVENVLMKYEYYTRTIAYLKKECGVAFPDYDAAYQRMARQYNSLRSSITAFRRYKQETAAP